MTMALMLGILGGALFLSLIVMAIILPIRPQLVRVTERFVCPTKTTMRVDMVRHGYHRSGERGIVVTCQGQGRIEYVNGKALLGLWLILYLVSLPLTAVVVLLVNQWFAV